jgi:acetolactate synthase I/II/III large subunit
VKRRDPVTKRCRVIHPLDLVEVLNRTLPQALPVVSDIGNTMAWLLRYLDRTTPYAWHVNLIHGSMGHSIPAALGASLATGAPVLAVLGDAAFMMSFAELHTASEYGIGLKAIVLNDGRHGMVLKGAKTQRQTVNPHYRFVRRVDAAGAASALGVQSYRVETVPELCKAISSMLAKPGPALVDASIDPEAMPPIGSRTGMLARSFAAGAQGR